MTKKSYFKVPVLVSIFGLLFSFLARATSEPVTLPGTNINIQGTIYMVTPEGTRRPYTSSGAFLSYGFNNWGSVQAPHGSDYNLSIGNYIPPQDGKIICSDRGGDTGTCYLISNGYRDAFTSAAVFTGQGFNFSRALSGDVSFMPEDANISDANQSHRPGVLIKIDNGTVFYVGQAGILGIPNLTTFYSWGFDFADVVAANSADLALPNGGTLPSRQPGELSPLSSGSNSVNNPTASLNLLSPSGSVAAGGKSVELFRVTIQAPASGSLNITQVSFEFGGNLPFGYLSNIKLMDAVSNVQVGSNSGNVLSASSGGFVVNPPMYLSNGQKRSISVLADIDSSAGGYSVNARLTQVWTSGNNLASLANVNGLPVVGNLLSVTAQSYASNPPVITGTGGPTSINAGTTGTWTVSAYDPANGNLSYYVDWGDIPYPMPLNSPNSPVLWQQSTSFTHVYSTNGIYNITFYVSNTRGSTAKSTISVKVSQNAGSPVTYFINPSSGPVGTTVTVSGSGFIFNGNTINIDGHKFTTADSSNGTSLSFIIPTGFAYGCDNNVPYTYPYAYACDPIWQTITPGDYKITVSNSNGTSNPQIFTVTGNAANSRDQKRLADIRQQASALELFFNDNNGYPASLYLLSPNYLGTLPAAPSPADGSCSTAQNSYVYTPAGNYNAGTYSYYFLSFCLSGVTGGYAAGNHILTPAGIY